MTKGDAHQRCPQDVENVPAKTNGHNITNLCRNRSPKFSTEKVFLRICQPLKCTIMGALPRHRNSFWKREFVINKITYILWSSRETAAVHGSFFALVEIVDTKVFVKKKRMKTTTIQIHNSRILFE